MDRKDRFEVTLHFIMAMCGGFLGGYAIFSHMSVFGSAQTANLIELIESLFGRNFGDIALRIGAFLIYILAIIIAVLLEKKAKFNIKYLCIAVELFCVWIIGFIPAQVHPLLSLYPMFFITAFQWCIFKGALGYTSSTIFSTNNIKQTVTSLTEYMLLEDEKKKQEKLRKAFFFGGTLLNFHIGVALSYIGYLFYGMHAIWLCSILLVLCLGYMIYEYEIKKDQDLLDMI